MYAVMFRDVFRHLLGANVTELFGSGRAGHAQLFDQRLVLPPPQELVIYHGSLPTAMFIVGMIRMCKIPTFIGRCGSMNLSRHMVV